MEFEPLFGKSTSHRGQQHRRNGGTLSKTGTLRRRMPCFLKQRRRRCSFFLQRKRTGAADTEPCDRPAERVKTCLLHSKTGIACTAVFVDAMLAQFVSRKAQKQLTTTDPEYRLAGSSFSVVDSIRGKQDGHSFVALMAKTRETARCRPH